MISSLDIVIVNWNSGKLLYECVQSINNAVNESFELNNIVVVDNASKDNSLSNIEDIKLPIKIIRNSENLGFAKSCNTGSQLSQSDYVLFLNPDTRLYENSLSVPISFLSNAVNEKVGIVGIRIIDEKGNASRNCARFPNPWRMTYMSLGLDRLLPGFFPSHFMLEWDHLSSRNVDQVMGSFFLIRRKIFQQLGGFDERFFVYYEDADLSFRAKKIGYSSYYLSESSVYHKGGGVSEKVKAIRLSYYLYSKLQFCKKHYNHFAYYFIFVITIMIEPFTRMIYVLLNGKFRDFSEVLRGYIMLYKKLFLTICFRQNENIASI